jgi:uncharacterized protein
MKKIIILLVFAVFWANLLPAQIPDRTNPPRLVNDFANILDKGEVDRLESKLVAFNNETSTQILVVTVPDLQGYDKSDFAFRLGEKWGVGQKGKDNGIVILVKPKTSESNGQVFVATGYGLEGVLPDAIVNNAVVDNEMIPSFKENNYYEGIDKGTNVIMQITRGEYSAEQYQQSAQQGGGSIVFFILLFVLFFWIFGRRRRNRFYSPGKSLPFWLAMGMLSGNRHSGGGSFGNFSSGSGGFGGGGFGGFGGGSFGGGGAGGSW